MGTSEAAARAKNQRINQDESALRRMNKPLQRSRPQQCPKATSPLNAKNAEATKSTATASLSLGCTFSEESLAVTSKISVEMRALTVALFLSAALTVAQSPAPPPSGPIPPAIRNAKKILVSNAGADSGLFPHPFSDNPDRPYDQFYDALAATGHYKHGERSPRGRSGFGLRLTAPYGPQNADKQKGASDPLPMFRLVIYDAGTH